jgi:hypothetical protein
MLEGILTVFVENGRRRIKVKKEEAFLFFSMRGIGVEQQAQQASKKKRNSLDAALKD